MTDDGGAVLTGIVGDETSLADIWVVHILPGGYVDWQKAYGKNNIDEAGMLVTTTSDGGYILAASSYSYTDPSLSNIGVLRLDADGRIKWQRMFASGKEDDPWKIRETPDGGFLLVSFTRSFGSGQDDIWIIKLKGNGAIAWQKTIGTTETDYPVALHITEDGQIILLGNTSYPTDEPDQYTYEPDPWAIKLDSQGNPVWWKNFAGSSYDHVKALTTNGNGDFAIVGYTKSFGVESSALWVIHSADDGNIHDNNQVMLKNTTVNAIQTSLVTRETEIGMEFRLARWLSTDLPVNDTYAQRAEVCIDQNQAYILQVAPTPTPPPVPELTRNLFLQSPAMQGDDVLLLQERLLELGYADVGTPDGIFGEMTDDAVRLFQETNGLSVDGIVGPQTWERLFSTEAVPAP